MDIQEDRSCKKSVAAGTVVCSFAAFPFGGFFSKSI